MVESETLDKEPKSGLSDFNFGILYVLLVTAAITIPHFIGIHEGKGQMKQKLTYDLAIKSAYTRKVNSDEFPDLILNQNNGEQVILYGTSEQDFYSISKLKGNLLNESTKINEIYSERDSLIKVIQNMCQKKVQVKKDSIDFKLKQIDKIYSPIRNN